MPINVVIGQTAARHLFPNEDPIGKRIKRGPMESPAPWMTIVGIAQDAKLKSADGDPANDFYISMQQSTPSTLAMLRAERPGSRRACSARRQGRARRRSGSADLSSRHDADSVVDAAIGQRRFTA